MRTRRSSTSTAAVSRWSNSSSHSARPHEVSVDGRCGSAEDAISMSRHPPEEEDTRLATIDEFQSNQDPGKSRDRAYLIVLAGSNVGEMYRLNAAETVLGRGTGATVRLNDDGISRRHARLLLLANEVIIEDLKSSNGTHV